MAINGKHVLWAGGIAAGALGLAALFKRKPEDEVSAGGDSRAVIVPALVDAQERASRYPQTFPIPPRGERESLEPGDLAKVMFATDRPGSSERLWVRVESLVEGGYYFGALDNAPSLVARKAGDPVVFGPEHIIDITRGT